MILFHDLFSFSSFDKFKDTIRLVFFFIREKIEEFNRELERLQKSLSAKEELEKNQIEAVI